MRQPRDETRVSRRSRPRWTGAVLALSLLLAGCASAGSTNIGLAHPAQTVSPVPAYDKTCAPVGIDTTIPCLRLTLAAVDAARAEEGLGPMVLPADFPRLTVPQQLFVAIDRERVDRGLAPFAGLTTALDAGAQSGADGARLPPRPGPAYGAVTTEWIGDVDNGLDADFEWLYDDGPHSGIPGCSGHETSGCWADRDIVLTRYGSPRLVMGAGYDATGDTSSRDGGGSSLAATLATATHAGHYAYSWKQALAAMSTGRLRPLRSIPRSESNTGISDPNHNVAPVPDYARACVGGGIDDSPACIGAVLSALNHAHTLEGIRPMVLPAGFAALSIPQQLFVVVDLERVDRGLPAFAGLTTSLDRNAQHGADDANDPPDPGPAYDLDDAEWAGGSSNGRDAVYGWMYDDGFDSGNLDCLRRSAAGCWGHRKGILDDFGSGPDLVMGAAVATTGDTHRGDKGGTSMAVTLAVAGAPAQAFTYSWAQVSALLPPGTT
jgi:hypothetical protein